MNDYIFRMPEGTPKLTFEALSAQLDALCDRPRCTPCTLAVGTTVTICWHGAARGHAVAFQLYGLGIAVISQKLVQFPVTGDAHIATTGWLAKIIRDNGLGSSAWRIRRHKADGPGTPAARGRAGLLCIDGDRDRPVEGHGYPVDHARIAQDRDYAERWAAELEFRRLHPAQWEADLAAAKAGSGMPDYRDRVTVPPGPHSRPSLSDIR